jgi:hypothetical protein
MCISVRVLLTKTQCILYQSFNFSQNEQNLNPIFPSAWQRQVPAMATMTTMASGRVGPKTGTNSDLAEERIQVGRHVCAPQTLRCQKCFNALPPSCVCACVLCDCLSSGMRASSCRCVSSHIVRTLHGALDTVNTHTTHRRDAHSASRPVACTGHAYADVAWSWYRVSV